MEKYHLGNEEVNGIIVGGEYYTGKIFYDNRCQTYNPIYADTHEELISRAEKIITNLKKENCPIGVYPDNSKWELRIY